MLSQNFEAVVQLQAEIHLFKVGKLDACKRPGFSHNPVTLCTLTLCHVINTCLTMTKLINLVMIIGYCMIIMLHCYHHCGPFHVYVHQHNDWFVINSFLIVVTWFWNKILMILYLDWLYTCITRICGTINPTYMTTSICSKVIAISYSILN